MILDLVYTNKDLYTFNQSRSKPIYLLSGLSAASLYAKGLCHLVNTLIFIDNKVNICTAKEKS